MRRLPNRRSWGDGIEARWECQRARIPDVSEVSLHVTLRPVVVHGTRGAPLIGMGLLNGNRLIVDSWEGGDVVIEESL